MQKITPFLWYNDNAEEAMNFYMSIFKNSKAGNISRYPEGSMGKPGSVMVAEFELDGQKFMALNGGPHFKFTEAVSFTIDCKGQEEVDYYWEKLSEGGEKSQCGWLKDKFGLSWQVVPAELGSLMAQKDPEKSKRVMGALMKMNKIVIKELEDAVEGK